MNIRGSYLPDFYNSGVHRLRTSLRPNVLLGGHCNYEHTFINPLRRGDFTNVIVGGLFSVPTNPKPNVFPTFYGPCGYCSTGDGTPNTAT
jgi:hypothetical protein